MQVEKTQRRMPEDVVYEEGRAAGRQVGSAGGFTVALLRGGGAEVCGDSLRYVAEEGGVIIVPDGQSYTVEAAEGATLLSVAIRSHLLPEGVKSVLRAASPICSLEDAAARPDALISALGEEYRMKDDFSREMLIALSIELCITLARAGIERVEPERVGTAVAKARAYAAEHFSEKLSLTEVAAICGVSPAYLSRRFVAECGEGFSDHVAKLRLGHAARLLRERQDMSITEIAFLTGFNDSNYFSDKFKRAYGTSPLKYRNR
ncbi:MAG: helix-turn-helix transcriptional regulator [Clostridia bacterium]|nr:helix-turn-helix transcriptional regulator [Clostridia bacterium]